ncbi:MAG TPA: DPP IV N-terminal domain-containing protein [Fimbriimonadales bacterium]|nr:DPP IV N-terminal domain-containing protein [Fimbriimonadales bacterium]
MLYSRLHHALLSFVVLFPLVAFSQDKLSNIPEYRNYLRMRGEIANSVRMGRIRVTWEEDGKSFLFQKDGKNYRYVISTNSLERAPDSPSGAPRSRSHKNDLRRWPERGRQYSEVYSPDESLRAFYRDGNVYISKTDGTEEFAVTTEGSVQKRVKFGIASWVYGEELGVREAMWWSPDGKKLAFYRIDERNVPDYFLTKGLTSIQSVLDVEAYPKAGAPNPALDLFVYDSATKRVVKLDVRDGKEFSDDVVGHYVYSVRWSPDGKELLFNRTNRLQNVMEFCASDPSTGKTRVIVREEWKKSWTENSPPIHWLDSKRFLWISERTGFRNIYLYEISGKLVRAITQHPFEVVNIERVVEKTNTIYYTCRSGDNPYKIQLHRVGLDGKGDTRLTDPRFHHSVQVAPDGKHIIDIAETHDTPPVTTLRDDKWQLIETLAESDDSKFRSLNLQKVELFTYLAADGKTTLYGMLHKPSNFDPKKKYPLFVHVYAGPESGMVNERFELPDALTELGFLVAVFDSRGTSGRGKAFKDEVYGKLGRVEIDDQAAGVQFLAQRPYIDSTRVGIAGTSYGGYASIMCLLRYPNVFRAACGSSSVTDWRNYDSIYTERYMGLPKDNKEGYRLGSAMTYASELKGELMIFFGTADDNVHPSNSCQLIRALQNADKSFEVQIAPDWGHVGIRHDRMLEFFVERFIRCLHTSSSILRDNQWVCGGFCE